MAESRYLSRWFLGVGVLLAVLGIVLWVKVPVRPMFPPYALSAFLSLGYGIYCRRQAAPRSPGR